MKWSTPALVALALLSVSATAKRNPKWNGYAPQGWRVISVASGALFGPSSDDVALVIEQTDPSMIIRNDGLGEAEINTNPRAILFLTRKGDSYAVKARADGFLPSEGDPENICLADPLIEGPGIKIKHQSLLIGLQYWQSCGSWWVTGNIYKFRADNGRLRLIGAESRSFSRAGGEANTTSINFLTGRKKHVENARGVGPEPEGGAQMPRPETTWSNVATGPYFLDMMKQDDCAEYELAPPWCGY